MLGAYFGAWMPAFFDGSIANLGIASRMLDKAVVATATHISTVVQLGMAQIVASVTSTTPATATPARTAVYQVLQFRHHRLR